MAKTTTTTQTTKPNPTNASSRNASNAPPVVNAIQHVELVVPDAAKARKFFEKQFGWKFETMKMPTGDYHTFRTPDGNGGGIVEPAEPNQPIATTAYINVQDCDATLRSCEKAGCDILMPVTDIPGVGRFFIFSYDGSPPVGCWQNTGNNNPSRN